MNKKVDQYNKMSFKAIIFCASVFLVQVISGQSCGRICIPQPGCGGSIAVSNNGGALMVTSVGPVSPAGIAVATDLALGGDLDLFGTLPFLSAVEFGTTLPTSGSAAVSYGCGDGTIAITQELGNPSGNNVASSSGLSAASLGCGCRRY